MTPSPLIPRVLSAAALLACGAVQAQANPYYVGAGLGFVRESNLFRVPEGASPSSDTVITTSLLGGLDQPIGRQRVRASVALRDVRYQDHSDLNHQGYSVNANLDWSTVERISGTVSLAMNQGQANYNPGDAPTTTKRNVQRADLLSATARIGSVTRLTGEATVSHSSVSYSAVEFAANEFRQDAVSAGVRYLLGGNLNLGAGLRLTEGVYPALDDRSTRKDLDLSANWAVSGASSINARLSIGRQEYSRLDVRNFSGLTGFVTWNWRPGGRTSLATTLMRDTGQETTVVAIGGPLPGQLDTSRVANILSLSANYELTGKVALDALLRYADRSLVGTTSFLGGGALRASGDDQTTTLSLGGRWAPLRSTLVRCSVAHDRRSSDTALSTPYRSNSFGCSAQITIG